MATSEPLNIHPEDHDTHHLKPRSYAASVEENDNSGAPQVYAGQGEDITPRSPRRNMHKTSGSLRMNGHAKDHKSNTTVVERFHDKDGDHLVSLAQESMFNNGKPLAARRRNSELLSGRKAGARWERSR